MKGIIIILVGIGVINATAQKKGQHFKMPQNASFVQGSVLVKIKEEYKEEVAQLSESNTPSVIKNVFFKSVHYLGKKEYAQNKTVGAGARNQTSVIDISKYFTFKFDPNEDVENYINQLYATGYFEIVEPEYRYHAFYTPDDTYIGQQYYLGLIKAFDAWDITKGDTSVVIAIVDSGGNLTHSDLSPNLFRNWYEIPDNGIDDDGNGFIDDYRGWDFVGGDTANILKPGFIGDNNPSIGKGGDISHGTWVAGCASAATNNAKGIAGVGYKTKLMFTKHSGDNQRTNDGSVLNPYAGMLYAADLFSRHNIRGIINCSFGGPGQSQIVQDIIDHIVLDQNCLVVAAAGNSNSASPSYPASYNNVLSVAATDQDDVRAYFSNFGTTVDLSAPGVGIYTTGYYNLYTSVDGTSFSSPIVSGAAALVWAKNPSFTAQQVGEQLRISADAVALYNANPTMNLKLGKGRLDIKRALTLELPSVRASNLHLVDQNGMVPQPGETAFLSFDFKNYLKATTSGLTISISTATTAVTISKNKIMAGRISEGATFSNKLAPFELKINSNTANVLVTVLITYSDGVYSDFQYESFYVNPTFLDERSNQISTTITGNGRIGFQDSQDITRTQGLGFIFNKNSMLYEMGLIMGTSTTDIFNNVRSVNNDFDDDFSVTTPIKQSVPGQRSSSEIYGEFSNSIVASSQEVVVGYRSLVRSDAPYDKFVILEYKIKNAKATPLNGFYFGIFSDWDISSGGQDIAKWDNSNNMGYVYPYVETDKPFAGIQLLTGLPAYYAIDNDSSNAGKQSFGLYDGFTKNEKFKTISAVIGSGNERLQTAVATGDDVSHVVSSGPYTISPGQTITIAFALHASATFTELQTSARYADSLYNYTMEAPKPSATSDTVCYKTPATLNASGANSINWYTAFTGGQLIFNGTQFQTGNLISDTTFYISNADHYYESVRTPVYVKVKANPKISLSESAAFCQGDTLTLSVARADSIIWNTGQTKNSIKTFSAGKYAVRVVDNSPRCVSKSDTIVATIKAKPVADFTVAGDLKTLVPISFNDLSTNAVDWLWDFGDGQNSADENPVHIYSSPANNITLSVTAANGCSDIKTKSIDVITAVEESHLMEIKIYPNPISIQQLHVVIDEGNFYQARLMITNSLGLVVYDKDISSTEEHVELSITPNILPEGLAILRFWINGKMIVRKLVKVQ